MNRTQPILDRFSIVASSLCALHCIGLPLVTALFPTALTTLTNGHFFHQLLVLMVIPSSLIALSLGCKRHRDKLVFLVGITGVLLLVLIALFGHDLLGEAGEKIGTVFSSLMIVAAHLRNYFLCKKDRCQH